MSIIHDALKRRETNSEVAPANLKAVENRGDSSFLGAAPLWIAAIGVIAAALLTYFLTRPSDITIVNLGSSEPQAQAEKPAPAPTPAQNSIAMEPPDELNLTDPIYFSDQFSSQQENSSLPYTFPDYGSTEMNTQADPSIAWYTQNFTSAPVTQEQPKVAERSVERPVPDKPASDQNQAVAPQPQTNSTSPSEAEPVIRTATGGDIAASQFDDLPVGAMTIEMADAGLQSLIGGVTVNGAVAAPGTRLPIGSRISTSPSGAASLSFDAAGIDLGNSSSASITRLERRSSATGEIREEVTVTLEKGELRSVVRPDQGSFLVTTPQVIASTNNGAFVVKTKSDGSVSVTSQGGLVKIVPTSGRDETYIVKANETLTFRPGKGISIEDGRNTQSAQNEPVVSSPDGN